jgi:catechol 2,3-dioxygenase-like lactoylglutathione lyase family enzyme
VKVRSVTPILNVSDVAASLRWFEKLGWVRSFTWNDAGGIDGAADANEAGPAQFAGVCAGEAQIFLCHGAQGSRGGPSPRHVGDDDTGGVWMSWWLDSPAEVDAAHALALREGITVTWPPTDEPWGVRECRIEHPDGHTIRLSAGLGED